MHEADLIRFYLWDDQGNSVSLTVPPEMIERLRGNLYSVVMEYNTQPIVRVNNIGRNT